MPVHRNTRRATTSTSRTTKTQSSRLVKLRSRVRKLMDRNLKDLTGNCRARMRWSAKGYARYVVIRGGKILKGWPTGIPFGNLSDVPGGQPVMELLLALWTSGVLRFEEANEDEVDLAVWNPAAVLPGAPLAASHPAAVETIQGTEDSEDPIEEAVWSSEVEGDVSEIEEFTD